MPKIKRNEHQIELGKDEDVIIKGRRFHVYFKNRYLLISLTNDICLLYTSDAADEL